MCSRSTLTYGHCGRCVGASGGTVDVASGIGGARACGIEYVECSSCGAFSACGGFAIGTE